MSRTFLYKLTADNGGAPCVTATLLTLALCKPAIRSVAECGDWIFGFSDNGLDNRLIYIARITGKLVRGSYYRAGIFQEREDQIYRWTEDGTLEWKPGALYHGSARDSDRDLGEHPKYPRANVLLSTDFRYFGRERCKVKIPPQLQGLLEKMGQGHRSDSLKSLKPVLKKFRHDVWAAYPSAQKLGEPTHTDRQAKCHGGKHLAVC